MAWGPRLGHTLNPREGQVDSGSTSAISDRWGPIQAVLRPPVRWAARTCFILPRNPSLTGTEAKSKMNTKVFSNRRRIGPLVPRGRRVGRGGGITRGGCPESERGMKTVP